MVMCFYVTTIIEWEKKVQFSHLGVVFLGSFLAYSLIKSTSRFLISLTQFYRALDGMFYLTSGMVFCFLMLSGSLSEIMILLSAGILVFFYVFPQFEFKNLRNLNGVKIYIVSLSWVLITGLYAFGDFDLNVAQLMYLVQRFLLILLATLPFEIRDLENDPPNLNTLAQTLGIKGVQMLGLGLAILILLLTFILKKIHGLDSYSVLVLLPFYLWSLKQVQWLNAPYFVSFWVELIPFFGLIFLYFQT